MSVDVRRPAEEVRPLVAALIAKLRPHTEWIEVAGSLRRGKATVGDVDFDVIPKSSYNAALDAMVESGDIQKARYGQKLLTRWGQKLRGFSYQGVHFESHAVDEYNRGYLWWLHTGPDNALDKANTFVVTMIKRSAPFALRDGYVWAGDQKLRIHTEQDWFDLLGIRFVEPAERSIKLYTQLLAKHQWGTPSHFMMRQQVCVTVAPTPKEKLGTSGVKKTSSVRAASYEWQSPWLQSNGRVLLHAGYGEWREYDPADEYAQFYLSRLRGDLSFRSTDSKRLQTVLEIHEAQQRRQQWTHVSEVAFQMISVLKSA